MKLYGYWRSSTSYRARIALNLKGLNAEIVPVNLLKGEQRSNEYSKLNPEMRVPMLEDNGHTLTQSLAIIEYLDEMYPQTPLLPVTPHERARVRALALAIACDITPLNNLGPLAYLTTQCGVTEEQKTLWIRHWMEAGFTVVEKILSENSATGRFCHGASPTLADCCLVPQVYNARRFGVDMTPYPTIVRIDAACKELSAFIKAHPSNQPDAV